MEISRINTGATGAKIVFLRLYQPVVDNFCFLFLQILLETMAKNQELGLRGEQMAAGFLLQNGYRVLERNWRWGKAEIDLIVQIDETLVFVEVKTRSHARFGYPDEAVGPKKERLMVEAATEYLYRLDWQGEFRFDVIAVLLEKEPLVEHYPDAFFPFHCEADEDEY